jgi:hypothetical protein
VRQARRFRIASNTFWPLARTPGIDAPEPAPRSQRVDPVVEKINSPFGRKVSAQQTLGFAQ